MKRNMLIGFLVALVLVISSPVGASILLDDWTLDLNGVDGITGVDVVTDIGQITFNGIGHQQLTALNPDGSADGFVDGLLTATDYIDTGGAIISQLNPRYGEPVPNGFYTGLNDIYQMNFDFSVDITGTSNNLVSTFTHPEPFYADGVLDIWVDGPADTFTIATNSTGAGFQDGVKIASFLIVPGEGGTFSYSTYDGSDDALFVLQWALPNILFDADGNDLSIAPYGEDKLLVSTDSNFDASPNAALEPGYTIGGGVPNTYPTIQDNWTANTGFLANGFGTDESFYVEEDGSARLQVVPEPSTFILLGAGLLGLGVIGRKRMRK